MKIILDILNKKTNIQKIAREKGIAPTLISLWKKQALDAIEARFQPQPKGRRKSAPAAAPAAGADLKQARNEARAAKIKAAHLENSLHETREKLTRLEEQLHAMAGVVGCKVVKEYKPRAPRAVRKSRKA